MMKKKNKLLTLLILSISIPGYYAQTSSSFNGNTMGLTVFDCSAFGFDALRLGPNTSFGNTAVGHETLRYNTTGEQNTGIGNDALWYNTTGNANTAVGCEAMLNNDGAPSVQGDNNTALGEASLWNNIEGDNNTGIGVDALRYNAGGNRNTADGYQALYSSIGTGPTFINDNTAIGYKAFKGNTLGGTSIENTVIGALAGSENIEVNYNTIVGKDAFLYQYANQSNMNTAIGYKAMSSWNTSSSYLSTNNTCMGSEAMRYNFNGISDNTAFGRSALRGSGPGGSAMMGSRNVAIGTESLLKNYSNDNVAIGTQALYNNTSGNQNTVVGWKSLHNSTQGSQNTVVGNNVAPTLVSGLNNTFIGSNITTSGSGFFNATALGAGVSPNSNCVYLGNTYVTTIEGTPLMYTTSDERFKNNINEKNVVGLDFILSLRPVTYHFERKKLDQHLQKNIPDSLRTNRAYKESKESLSKRESGFIAQEVEKAMEKTGYDFHGLKKAEGEEDVYRLRYGVFVVPLVKAIQEQQKLIEEGNEKNKILQAKINERDLHVTSLILSNSQSNDINFENSLIVDKEYSLIINEIKSKKNGFVAVYNLSGKQVISKPLETTNNKITFDTESLKPGIYNVSIIIEEEITGSHSIIIKHK